ncbi:uncharacterized protein LOC112553757 isoform X2 [Pomacea canaliculata]|uniref:uncharacterized protein LOC112553757 isoform X2 n=1 Tax=Pomacea canaliculata TaxID=400727 RepID=UPI000D7254A0|nr:uncharacterized protein LOC112553757 isoform X2 [Pomacea canaliculata]
MANKEASPAIQYHIHSTQNLTVAEEITVVESAEIDGAESDADDVGVIHNGCTSRCTQTIGHIIRDSSGDTYITQNLNQLRVIVNHEAMDMLIKNDFRVDKVQDTVHKCLMRLNWNGEEILRKALTAFKLTLKEDMMPNLLKEVKDIILGGANLSKMLSLTEALFKDFSMKWLGIDLGSLVFIFEHKSEEDCKKTLEGQMCRVRRERIIDVLFKFLPSWVPRDYRLWDVSKYTLTDKDFLAWQSYPVSFYQGVYSEERSLLRIEQKLEEMLEKIKASLEQSVVTQIKEFAKKEMSEYLLHFKQETQYEQRLVHIDSGKPESIESEPKRSHVNTSHFEEHQQAMDGISSKPRQHQDNLNKKHPVFHAYSATSMSRPDLNSPLYSHFTKEDTDKKWLSDYNLQDQTLKSLHLQQVEKQSEDMSVEYKSTNTEPARETSPEKPPPPPDDSSEEEKEEAPSPKKSKEQLVIQAEQLLNWVNVKSRASQSKDPEIVRMMDQVIHALADEDHPAPKARALDTILVLDTSDSVADQHLDALKAIAHTFVDGIEEMVDSMNLEENLAVVQIGKGRAWVRQHLTNDYSRVRETIDEISPHSAMETGGKTPLFQALMVCLGAIEGRGGLVNIAGCHRVRPRIIMVTDGRPTDEATEHGKDLQTNINEVKFALVQLVTEFVSKKHKTTPSPIFWVPVGSNPDRPFLESLAGLSNGKVVDPENIHELCRYYKTQETIGCVYKMVRKHPDMYQTKEQVLTVVTALAGNLEISEKDYIVEEVCRKQSEPDNEQVDADDFNGVFEDTERVKSGVLLPLGTRVVRGQDWKWGNQDKDQPGTVIQHRQKDNWIYVLWDHGTHNAYRYGDGGQFDVMQASHRPRILADSELIEVGVQVEKGKGWKSGEDVGDGKGVVIRKRKDGKIKVRWSNGYIGKYRFTSDKNSVLQVSEICYAMTKSEDSSHVLSEEDQGAVGGHDPSEGLGPRVWFWRESKIDEWHMYDPELQEKIQSEYKRRPEGSCVVRRNGLNRRVLFKTNQEKTVDKGLVYEVKSEVVSEGNYQEVLQKEI